MSVLVSPIKIDVRGLLEPIPGSNPAGESLRYQGTYDRISEARREDDPKLSQGIYKSTLKRADWTTVEALCVEALTTRTKDLQLAGWLLESWIHRYGFAGVARGLALMAGPRPRARKRKRPNAIHPPQNHVPPNPCALQRRTRRRLLR